MTPGTSRIPVRRVWSAGTDARQRRFCDSQSSAGKLRDRHSRCRFAQGAYTVSFVLQQQADDWKLGGFYAKPTKIAGHDGNWFADRAREFKAKGQNRNAWFYYGEARELLVPVPFMATATTDKLYDEMQTVKPADLPPAGPDGGNEDLQDHRLVSHSRRPGF